MAVCYICRSCGSLQVHSIGFDSKQSFDSSSANAGGDATCQQCGRRHEYRKADLIWRQDKSAYHDEWEAGRHNVRFADFLLIVDGLDPKVRDESMMLAFMNVIKPRTAVTHVSRRDRLGDIIEPVNYRIFKERGKDREARGEAGIVERVVQDVLDYLYPRTDYTKLPEIREDHRRLIERCERAIEEATGKWDPKQLQDLIAKSLDWIANAEKQVDRHIYLYETFCYDVVRRLLSRID
jgi:transcription elongation factor Elf1